MDTTGRKRWRAPQHNGEWLLVPPLTEITTLLATQTRQLRDALPGLARWNLDDLRDQARTEVAAAALAYTQTLESLCPSSSPPIDPTAPPSAHISDTPEFRQRPWILGGHQPALFHPGVWAKNFAQGWLAQQSNAVSLNLIVDNDLISLPGIKLPAGTPAAPSTDRVLFDQQLVRQPWEEARVHDTAAWESFGTRVATQMRQWSLNGIFDGYWSHVTQVLQQTGNLVQALAAARHAQEVNWGVRNLELPLSLLSQTPAFLRWACHLFVRAKEFRLLHNAALADYRRVNRVRSPSQPVPDLVRDGHYIETPFWAWQAGSAQRLRLHIRDLGADLELSDGQTPLLVISRNKDQAVAQLQAWQASGWRLRTRALTTTLFCRVCLADLFVHGIGGAKYDEVTDRLIAGFWELPVPRYWTVTGTLRLPLGGTTAREADLQRLDHQTRDQTWNPVPRTADTLPPDLQLKHARFWELVQSEEISPAERHHALAQIKQAFRDWNSTNPQAIADHLALLERRRNQANEVQANRVLNDREWASVLFAAAPLKDFLRTPWRGS